VQYATTFYLMGFSNIWNWTDSDGATQVPMYFQSNMHSAILFSLDLLWTSIWWGMALYTLSSKPNNLATGGPPSPPSGIQGR
jgi:hypothetical protein